VALVAAPSLNVFQRLIRQWDSLHPYNAAQVMRLRCRSGRADVDQWNAAWLETLNELNVGAVPVIAKRLREPESTAPVRALVELDIASITLEQHITNELNRPFDPSGRSPFRPFVLHEDQSCWVGVVYQHWVGDSVSIRLLMREWFLRVHDPKRARRRALPLARGGYWMRYGSWRSDWRLLENIFSSVVWTSKLKRARRVEGDAFAHPTTTFTLHRLPPGIVPALLDAARREGVTLNDLMLAAIARVCDRHIAAPPTAKRQDLALGTIVDLRGSAGRSTNGVIPPPEEFGLFLGFTSVYCRRREMRNWRDLLRDIAKQNARQKSQRAADASMVRMFAGVLAGQMLQQRTLLNWYRKRLPLCAGISNVNLNRTWATEYQPDPVMDYVRVSPVGPVMPVVFTPSTLGDDLHFGLTCRDAAVPPSRAQTVAGEFMRILIEVASGNTPS
jgi:hypothetical protein